MTRPPSSMKTTRKRPTNDTDSTPMTWHPPTVGEPPGWGGGQETPPRPGRLRFRSSGIRRGRGGLGPASQLRQPDDLRETPGFAAPPRDGCALIGAGKIGTSGKDYKVVGSFRTHRSAT